MAPVVRTDLDAGQAAVNRLFKGLDVALPPVGCAFSDSVKITCGS